MQEFNFNLIERDCIQNGYGCRKMCAIGYTLQGDSAAPILKADGNYQKSDIPQENFASTLK
jgi:hypothetical protein